MVTDRGTPDPIAIPAEAAALLTQGVKAWRAALLVLEPYNASSESRLSNAERGRLRIVMGSIKAMATAVEQQIITSQDA